MSDLDDRELIELRELLLRNDCRLDTNVGTEKTIKIILSWKNEQVREARIEDLKKVASLVLSHGSTSYDLVYDKITDHIAELRTLTEELK